MEKVVLVNEQDEETGIMEKIEAHEAALLHRAFSIFIFNSKGELLLQQRALDKYHSGGLWTNTCCSHPRPGEDVSDAAHRRLKEEMGFDTDIFHAFSFIYKTRLDKGLTEHEFDHVFTGIYEKEIFPNASEVAGYDYKSITEIRKAILAEPHSFTTWFKIAFERVAAVQIPGVTTT